MESSGTDFKTKEVDGPLVCGDILQKGLVALKLVAVTLRHVGVIRDGELQQEYSLTLFMKEKGVWTTGGGGKIGGERVVFVSIIRKIHQKLPSVH